MNSQPLSEKLQIINRLGLHTRAAAQFVKIAQQFSSQIFIIQDKRKVSGKSIMGILTLAAGKGSWIVLEVHGEDQEEAFLQLKKLVQNGFNER